MYANHLASNPSRIDTTHQLSDKPPNAETGVPYEIYSLKAMTSKTSLPEIRAHDVQRKVWPAGQRRLSRLYNMLYRDARRHSGPVLWHIEL